MNMSLATPPATSHDAPQPAGEREPRFALGQSVGLAAFVWAYPLVETMRTCRLQTAPRADETPTWAAAIDRLQHTREPAGAQDRDIVTPANDLLYTTGWINLANGPRRLQVPASTRHGGRYFVLALYDAWTNNFANPGLRNSDPAGETVLLVGPGGPLPQTSEPGVRVLQSPTDLVWLIARVVVGDGDDLAPARALQSEIRLDCPPGTDSGTSPRAVTDWVGAAQDTMAALEERPDEASAIAAAFFANMCQCLDSAPPPATDRGMQDWFAHAGLTGGGRFDWQRLEPPLRDGLLQGLLDGAALLRRNSRSRRARAWATSFALGRYGSNYLTRTLTAYKGLGGLASDEAVYAMGDFDSQGQPLQGSVGYTLRFEPAATPPVDAFWSVTLYAADRFLYPNPIARYSIGDRTPGLLPDPDGGLTLQVGHRTPANTANWLPAPPGNFYLILRMYCPREEVRGWKIPPLQALASQPTPENL